MLIHITMLLKNFVSKIIIAGFHSIFFKEVMVNWFQAVYHTMEHEAPDPDSDESIEPEAKKFNIYIGLCYFINELTNKGL